MRTMFSTLSIPVILLATVVLLAFPAGYILNIVKLCDCDFDASYKAEIIRGIGIVLPPVGCIVGYFSIADGDNL